MSSVMSLVGSSALGRWVSRKPRPFAKAVPEHSCRGPSLTSCRQTPARKPRGIRSRVAKIVEPGGSGQPNSLDTSERFLDVNSLLNEFNPLTGSHLLVWEDSDEEDGVVQAEVPLAGAWEDSPNGFQGMEYNPSWVDYRGGSESDDADVTHLQGALGASKALAALMPRIDDAGVDDEVRGRSPEVEALHLGGKSSAAVPNAYSPEAGFQEIPPHELEERLATGQVSLLLDVRSRQEYDSGHISGALNLPLDPDLSEAVRSGSLDEYRGRPVAVVCGSGMRSSQATVRLTKVYGFRDVSNVTGGMKAWRLEGLPVQAAPVQGQQQLSGGGGSCGCGGSQSGGGGCRGKQAM